MTGKASAGPDTHLRCGDAAQWGAAAQQGSVFGEELYRARTRRGLSQAATAKASRLTRGYYSQLENSRRFPPPPLTLKRIAAALKLSPAEGEKLQSLAETERSQMLRLPREIPTTIANVLRRLAQRAHQLSPALVRELEILLVEE